MAYVHNKNHAKRWSISNDFGLRSPVIQKKKKMPKNATRYLVPHT